MNDGVRWGEQKPSKEDSPAAALAGLLHGDADRAQASSKPHPGLAHNRAEGNISPGSRMQERERGSLG